MRGVLPVLAAILLFLPIVDAQGLTPAVYVANPGTAPAAGQPQVYSVLVSRSCVNGLGLLQGASVAIQVKTDSPNVTATSPAPITFGTQICATQSTVQRTVIITFSYTGNATVNTTAKAMMTLSPSDAQEVALTVTPTFLATAAAPRLDPVAKLEAPMPPAAWLAIALVGLALVVRRAKA